MTVAVTGKSVLQPITSVWPIHRKQLLEEILSGSQQGNIYRVWVTRGHIFVSLDKGTKLYTFDVKPVGIGQDYQFGNLGCLDLTDLHAALKDVLYSQKLISAILVQEDGQVQLWKFVQNSYKWEKVCEDTLCSGASEVLSVCIVDQQSVMYWCERPVNQTDTNCTVWKRDLLNGNYFGSPVKVLDNCPQCELFPLVKGVFASLRQSLNISGLVFLPYNNTVSVCIGDNVFSHRTLGSVQCPDFKDVILPHLSKIKQRDKPFIRGLFDPVKSWVVLVNSNGEIRYVSGGQGTQVCKNLKLKLESHNLKDEPSWCFLHRDCICQVTSDNVRLHNYMTGEVTQQNLSETVYTDVQLGLLSPSPYFRTLMTADGLKAIQMRDNGRHSSGNLLQDVTCYSRELLRPRCGVKQSSNIEKAEMVCKSFLQGSVPSRDFLVDGKCFQNPALVITLLDQLQEKVNTAAMTKERKAIIQKYSQLNTYKHTHYNESIVPYLNEYMKIEKTCSDIFSQKHKALVPNTDCVEREVLNLIDPASNFPLTLRQAQLELLILRSPETVLITLMQQLDIESQELSEEEMEKWSYVLASESSISTSYTGGTFSLYEIITRLLFQQKPDQLVNFVHISQLIHDKNVGVSAFIRKRQTFQFYERALSCFPRPESSKDVIGAVRAMTQLMLAMQTRSNLVRAVKLLIRYEQWEAAVELLKEQADNSPTHQEVFYILLTSVANYGVLSKYCVPVLQHVPDNTSLMSVLEMIGSHGKGNQPITRPQDVFCRGSSDVQLGQVQQIFLTLLKKNKSGD